MINHTDNFEAVVKDELHKAARAHGIDPSMVGHALSSTFGPIQVGPNQQTLAPCWLLVLSLRVELVGTPPVVVPMTIPYTMNAAGTLHMPAESDMRGALNQAFGVLVDAREHLLHPETVPGAVAGRVVG